MFWKKKYDFYLAGKMRGCPNLNKDMFTLVARLLREKGFTVWSPSEHDSYLKLSFAQCMTADLNAIINKCRKIALLPNWRDSQGANVEALCAFATGKESVEVVLNTDNTDIELMPFDLNVYHYPYREGKVSSFNPHKCELHSFTETQTQ
ncbi:hypothetical protein LCGC14_0140830 [marine sediment metagenome]|uniref:DUF1937 domain-containing protein n=1 Tax=marine sediment metagenome TaxID=412755 RepID=A0A0F9VG96_9ZZZZ